MELATDGNRIRHFDDAPSAAAPKPAVIVHSPAPQPAPARWRRVAPVAVVVGCVLAGLGLRAAAFAKNQSLWIDEAMLALNVVYRTPAELLQPLDLNQGAPVGYLMMSKLTVNALGGGELALRLPSLVAGLLGMAVFVPLAYRALPLAAARLAVALYCLSPYLIGYCAEFKQYELDAAIAAGLTALGVSVWRCQAGPGRLAGFAAAGAVAVWFSHPAAFVLGGVGGVALLDALVRKDRAALLARLAVVGAWAGSFGVCYLLFTRKLGANQYLLDFWADRFMPLPPTRPGHLAWFKDNILLFFRTPVGLGSADAGGETLATLCWLAGGLALARADWRLAVGLSAPLALAMLASGFHKYPFSGRLLLFAVPAALLVVGHGAALLADRLGRAAGGAGVAAVVILFLAPLTLCHWHTKRPVHAEDAREVIAHAHAGWQPGDKLYVFYAATPAFAYYYPQYPFPMADVKYGAENRGGDQIVFQQELQSFRGEKRVWVLIVHRQSVQDAAIRAYLDGMGTCEETVRLADAVALRYDLTRAP